MIAASAVLHLQWGLGEGPARAGLVFAPAAIGFAVTGLTWRRLPVLVAAAFALGLIRSTRVQSRYR
ncbi:MAG: hypothetical protein ABJB98_09605 [Actinomycetota bacterium]